MDAASNARTTVGIARLISEEGQNPVHDDNDPSTFTNTLLMKTLTGKTLSLNIKWYWIVYDLMVAVQDLEGIATDQQRLIYNKRQLEESRSLYDYGLHRGNATLHLVLRLRGGGAEVPLAFAIVETAWSGNMLYPTIKGIKLDRTNIVQVNSLASPGWLYGEGPDGKCGYFPLTYVRIARIFNQSLRDELIATSSDFISTPLPEVQHQAHSTYTTGPQTSSSVQERRGILEIFRKLFCLGTRTVPIPADTDPLAFPEASPSLAQELTELANQLPVEPHNAKPPSLPPFPYPDPNPPHLVKVKLGDDGDSFVTLEFSCSKFKSPDDKPTVTIIFKCFPIPPSRISSAILTFDIPGNELVDLSPREQLGPLTETQISKTSNQKVGVQAGFAAEGVNIGASFSTEKGVEKSGTQHTQLTVKGSTIGTTTARWTLIEDTGEAAFQGLPMETAMSLTVKYKPPVLAFKVRVVVATGRSEGIYEKNDFASM